MSDSNWSNPYGGWDDAPLVCASDVMSRWTQMLGHEQPWAAMPSDDVRGMMRPMLSELLNEGRDVDHDDRQRRLVRFAHDHGAFRSAQKISQAELVAEIGIVRDALEGALRKMGMGTRAARETLAALDAELTLAERAAVRGWYRGRVKGTPRSGSWFEKLLDELE